MKKLFKAVLILGAFLIVAAGVAAFLAQRLLPPEKVRSLIVSQAGKALRREVRLGDVSWSLVRGLSVADLEISESPDFSKGTFARMKAFGLRVRWMPLLRGKVVVDTVSADGLEVSVVKKADGTSNFSDLAGSTVPATAAAGASPAGLPVELAVRRARLSGAKVSYKDLKAGDELTLTGLDLKVADFALSGPFAVELSLGAEGRSGGRPLKAAVAFSGKVDLGGADPAKVSADIKKLVVDSMGLSLGVSGRVAGLKEPAFDLKLSAAAGGAKALSGDASGTVVLGAEGAPPRVKAAFKLESAGFPTSAFKELGAPEGWKVPAGRASGKVDYAGGKAALEALRLESPEGWITASGAVEGLSGAKPVLDLELGADLKLPQLSAADLPAAPLPKGLVVPATALKLKARLKGEELELASLQASNRFGSIEASGKAGRLGAPRADLDLSASLDLSLPAFKDSDLPWAGLPKGLNVPALAVKGKVKIAGETVSLSPLVLENAPGGKVELSGAVRKAFSAKPELALDAVAKVQLPAFSDADLPFAGLPKGFKAPPLGVSGKISVKGEDVDLSGLEVKSSAGTVELSGKVKGALGAKPEPELDAAVKLSLPAFKSADIAWAPVAPDLAVPPLQIDAVLWASLDEARIKTLRVITGKNDLEIDGGKVVSLRSGSPLFNILFKCRSFDLQELTQLSPQTRELGLKGSGIFAVGVTGRLPKPLLEGKLQFKGLGADVAGLKLSDFSGTARFDEKRIDIPDLKGNVADGELTMDLTVKNYATAPDVDLQAALTRFDLGAFLKAKEALAKPKPAAQAAGAEPAKPPPPMDLKGRFTVGKLVHPNAEAQDLQVEWELTGVTPDMKSLGGTAKLSSAQGKFTAIGEMAAQSKVVKVLVMPLIVIQKIGRLGGIKLFPDFNNVTYSRLTGDYRFSSGVMSLEDSTLVADAFTVVAKGLINLPAESLDLAVTAQVGNVAPIDVDVKGTFDKPVTKTKLGKFLAAPVKQALDRLIKK